jgi:hypothetical protein
MTLWCHFPSLLHPVKVVTPSPTFHTCSSQLHAETASFAWFIRTHRSEETAKSAGARVIQTKINDELATRGVKMSSPAEFRVLKVQRQLTGASQTTEIDHHHPEGAEGQTLPQACHRSNAEENTLIESVHKVQEKQKRKWLSQLKPLRWT